MSIPQFIKGGYFQMDSKKARKLSKATVATVIAASGVIIAMPQSSKAAAYSDLNPLADYYQPVIDLANRNIAIGYPDGTFRPNQAITREDAAKMLALAIDVNIANPKNPGFKDVNVNNPNYRYIAALAEAGIINGFTDKTFKPKEYITRGQMAKIITLGFKFGMSQKLNNSFRDVSATNFAAYYIQTLVDINVTKGTTSVTFDPFKNVTRAQMATFIWRAEKADRGTPVYTVGDVSDTQIYINGVAYSIASHLRSILNASNKNVLQGAYIEGTFSGKTLTNITKLTLNASGTSTRLMALNGNYTSFAGELVVNGSYIRLKNINFTGRVEIATPPRRSLATLQNVRIASVTNFANFIDWDTPTEPKNEDFLNPSDDETLKDKPTSTSSSKYKDRMANIQKYVDFEGSDVRNLVVTADRTFLKSNYDIDRLTVRGDVTNFEFYGDATAMYLDNDYNMTLYGVHDIVYAYKNSLKNVKLNSDSTYDYYYVTTKSGFTDLGDFAYINDAIIPKGTTVNTIFDDFETDEPQIGWIEDENGTPVSRDPVGDTVILDVTAPEITQLDVNAGGTIADVTLTADEDGTYYYVIKKASEKAPTISEIKTGGVPLSGHGAVIMDEPVKFQVSGLESKTEYVIYAIVIDGQDNASDKEDKEFTTIDSRPPSLNLEPGEKMYGGKRVQFKVTPSEVGTIYYYIRPDTSAAAPTIEDIISSPTGIRKANTSGEIIITSYEHGKKNLLEDIQPRTKYQIFAVMVDESGNKMRYVEEITITTEVPDTTNPYVINPQELVLADKDKGYFYINVSEELDKETAENPDNYLLSGTGIVNISGHKEMKPLEVQYSNKQIRLTIPSLTSLVNGDTVVATVLKGVKDLAENEFENSNTVELEFNPRNYAQYNHTDALAPKIEIKNVIASTNKYEVEVNTNKAGTYYYMILPDTYESIISSRAIISRDFVDEFSTDASYKTGKFQSTTQLGIKTNDYVATGQNPASLGTFKFNITQPTNLDPFTNYSIYMVLKDRSGQLSQIINRPLINDTKPPLVSGYSITNVTNNDTQVKVTVSVDERSNFYVLPVKKYKLENGTYVLNSEYFDAAGNLKDLTDVINTSATATNLFNKFKSLGAKDIGGATGKGIFDFIPSNLNLSAHEEYGFYIGAVDTIGNFTILRRSSDTELTLDEPKGPQMKATLYMDGTKPYITNDDSRSIVGSNKGIVYRNLDGTFTITFNEVIMRQKDTNITALTTNTSLSSILTIEGGATGSTLSANDFTILKYETGASTSKSKLTIRPNASANVAQNITVTMKDKTNAYDYYDQNAFDLSQIGKYVYPGMISNTIKWVSITAPYSPSNIDPTGNSSKTISVDLDSTIAITNGQRYYYAASVGRETLTEKEIMDYVNSATVNNESDKIYIGGTGTITTQSQLSNFIPIENKGQGYFKVGHYFHLFTIDDFGNVTWATNPATPTKIEKIVPTP